MDNMIRLHRKIAPELIEAVDSRYTILRHIRYVEPVGRRTLALQLHMSERIVRAEVDFLKSQGLLDVTSAGVVLSQEGKELLTDLREYIHRLRGLSDLQIQLGKLLALQRVVVVPGNADCDLAAKVELGRAAAVVLEQQLSGNMIVAVTGGTTTAQLAQSTHRCPHEVTVVPARGGLGEEVEYQANTIAATMAKRMGGSYRLLHIPDDLPDDTVQSLFAKDHHTREIAAVIKQANILIHGIGLAKVMAERRNLQPDVLERLLAQEGAVGEALGHYFNPRGEVAYATNSVGLRLKDLAQIHMVIAVAGGKQKAPAIVAVTNSRAQDILITDEGAAREMIVILKNQTHIQEAQK